MFPRKQLYWFKFHTIDDLEEFENLFNMCHEWSDSSLFMINKVYAINLISCGILNLLVL